MTAPAEGRAPSAELGRAARGSLVTLVGAATSSGLGFVLGILVARGLGTQGAGVVFQTIAVFTIALSVCRLGLDTTAVWLLPRLRAGSRERVPQAVTALLAPTLAVSLLVSVVAGVLVALGGVGGRGVVAAAAVALIFLPAAGITTVALAATRAFGGVMPYNAVGNVLVPGLRLVGVAVALWAGGGPEAAALGWAAPWLVGAVLALVVLLGRVRRLTPVEGRTWRPDGETIRTVRRFSLPRLLASVLDQSIIWLDVILVGVIAGAGAAGVYGAVSRFVSAGALVGTSLRIVVAPRFSALLGEGRTTEVERLYRATARWILLLGAPAYVILAIFATTVLSWLGSGFGTGRTAMLTLCLGSIVVLAAGNIQSLLLMSGRSGAAALNKVAVLSVNVVGNVLLIPHFGIEAAAGVWAFSMVLDTVLAAVQVVRSTGITLAVGALGAAGLAVTVLVGAPSLAIALALGQGAAQLALAVLASGAMLLAYVVLDRRRLEIDQILGERRR